MVDTVSAIVTGVRGSVKHTGSYWTCPLSCPQQVTGVPSTIGTAQNTYATFAPVENRCKSLIAPQKHWGFGPLSPPSV